MRRVHLTRRSRWFCDGRRRRAIIPRAGTRQKRGAHIYCELAGYGNTADAHHLTSPSPGGEGAVRCMKMALRTGGLNAGDVSYVNAHGTSTPVGDATSRRRRSIKTVSGDHAKTGGKLHERRTGHMLCSARARWKWPACALGHQAWCGAADHQLCRALIRSAISIMCRIPRRAKMEVTTVINNWFGFGAVTMRPSRRRSLRGKLGGRSVAS